jgi:hypothetical protein
LYLCFFSLNTNKPFDVLSVFDVGKLPIVDSRTT